MCGQIIIPTLNLAGGLQSRAEQHVHSSSDHVHNHQVTACLMILEITDHVMSVSDRL